MWFSIPFVRFGSCCFWWTFFSCQDEEIHHSLAMRKVRVPDGMGQVIWVILGHVFTHRAPKRSQTRRSVRGTTSFFFDVGEDPWMTWRPRKRMFYWKLSSDPPGTNGLKNQHFADFLYKSAVLEDVLNGWGLRCSFFPVSQWPPILDPSIFFRQGLGDGTWLCANCDFRPEWYRS